MRIYQNLQQNVLQVIPIFLTMILNIKGYHEIFAYHDPCVGC